MQDYELIDNGVKKGIINVYWDNINAKHNKSMIENNKISKYKILNVDDIGIKYELNFIIKDVDELYDIVKKYIKDDSLIFKEIERIKKYNKIKTIKKETNIKLKLHEVILKKFNKTKKDIDKNSIIKSKIYFIKNVIEKNNFNEMKNELDKIILYFNNIITSKEYEFYDNEEKDKVINKAIKSLDKLINEIEMKTTYKYGKHFIKNLKIIM